MRRSGLTIMGRLIGLVAPLLHIMLLAVLMGVAGYLCAIFIPVLGGWALLDALALPAPLGVTAALVLAAVCGILRGVLRYAEQRSNHYIAFKLLAHIRDRVFTALRRLAPAKLEGKEKGELISVITSDIELLEVFYAHTISPIAIAAVVSAVMTAFLWSYHPLPGLLALLGYLTVGAVIPLLTARLGRDAGMEARKGFGALNAYFLDSLRGLRESIQYGTGEARRQTVADRTDGLDDTQRKLKDVEGIITGVTGAAILLFSLVMLAVTLRLYSLGAVSFAGVLIPTVAMMSSFAPVTALSNLSNNLFLTLASGDRVLDLLEEEPQVEEVSGGKKAAFTGAECRKVDFSYGADPILDGVSLSVPEGRIVGVSGRSGSGKSTLLKLLMRFWDVGSGAVELSGTDVKELNTACLRDLESYVTQETVLFHDTIENNIKIGRLDATREQVAAAAKKAALHDFILTLPQGYDTHVGELGDTLSGGERQRIGVARAFLHDAPFLLLDEPTSNLDSLSEGIILKALREEGAGRTIVLVSHRASTMGVADTVYKMDSGRVS